MVYYGKALDHTILPALNEIASEQSSPTQSIKEKSQQLMEYVAIYPNAYIRYYASNIIFNIDSDAAYLVAKKAQSRVAGYYHLSFDPKLIKNIPFNEAIHIECYTLMHIVSSTAKAEVSGIFTILK